MGNWKSLLRGCGVEREARRIFSIYLDIKGFLPSNSNYPKIVIPNCQPQWPEFCKYFNSPNTVIQFVKHCNFNLPAPSNKISIYQAMGFQFTSTVISVYQAPRFQLTKHCNFNLPINAVSIYQQLWLVNWNSNGKLKSNRNAFGQTKYNFL